MSSNHKQTGRNEIPIVGYTDKLSVQPGQKLSFMISCDYPKYGVEIVRMRSTDFGPNGPRRSEKRVATNVAGEYNGRKQDYHHGSYGAAETNASLPGLGSFSIQSWIYSTTPLKGLQGIVTSVGRGKGTGLGLYIDEKGALCLVLKDSSGERVVVSTGKPLRSHCWYFVAATYDAEKGRVTLYQLPRRDFPGDSSAGTVHKTVKLGRVGLSKGSPILIGASGPEDRGNSPTAFFNGKIDRTRVFSRSLSDEEIRAIKADANVREFGLELVADWDFSQGVDDDRFFDESPYALHGAFVNSPKRAVTGYNWSGDEIDFKRAPDQYGAVHFHDDDLDDCRWDVDFTLEVPEDFASGIYAAKLETKDFTQYIPFFVRPKRGTATSKIAFLVATLSYLAYGDEHMLSGDEDRGLVKSFKGFQYPRRPMEKYLVENRLNSLYDKHSDGSGVCYSSRLRPVLTIGPDYRLAILGNGTGAPHQFSADLLLVDWMEEKGFEYDVVTDEDLHHEGASLLRPYKVVVTGSHHEYWSGAMLDALEQYLQGGGRAMYMGGNGFYWITTVNPKRPHIVEVRRWGGTGSWKSDPGEYYLSSTGELGGLWRNRGRAPQRYVGVGFAAQGFDTNRPYKRMPGSFDPSAAFIFEGIGKDELIGDFDNIVQIHGAAGFEIDRVDDELGTPPSTLVLATATGFSDSYLHVLEENTQTAPDSGGSVNPLVKADMTYTKYPNEGAIFSTSSISYVGCLCYNDYDNNVSRLTENVLKAFSTRETLP